MFDWLRAREKKYKILTDQQRFYKNWMDFLKKIGLFMFMLMVLPFGASITLSPTDSMLPTLYGGDMLAMHGCRPVNAKPVSIVETAIGNKRLSKLLKDPLWEIASVGSVCAFNTKHYDSVFCKRLVAIGSRVEIHAGTLLIDGKSVPMEYAGEFLTKQNGRITSGRLFRRYLNGSSHLVLFKEPYDIFANRMDFMPEIQLKKDHCLFLGDNFYGSADGRYLFGPVAKNAIVGSISGALFQIQEFSANPLKLLGSINKKRFFVLLHPEAY
jgi:signal peptidase I